VLIVANTDDVETIGLFVLATWTAKLSHGCSVEFDSASSELFDLSSNDADGATTVVASIWSDTASSAATSSHLVVATLAYRVSASATESLGSAATEFSLLVEDMVSSASLMIVKNVTGGVLGQVSMGSSGQIRVEAQFDVGVYAYVAAQEQEMANLAVVGAPSQSSEVTVQLVHSCHTTGGTSCLEPQVQSTPSAGEYSCTGANASVACVGSSSCVVDFGGDETSGGDVLMTVAHNNDMSAQVLFRVWYQEDVAVTTGDGVLNRLVSVEMENKCDGEAQSAVLKASAQLVTQGFEAGTFGAVDLTPWVTFVVLEGNASSVFIVGSSAQGVAAASGVVIGCSSVYRACGAVARIALEVSDVEVSPMVMDAYLLNSLSVTSYDRQTVSFAGMDTFEVTSTLGQSLTAEGDSAKLFFHVGFSDGAFLGLSSANNVSTEVLGSAVGDVEVSAGWPAQVTVSVGASGAEGVGVIQSTWWLCGAPVASARPYVLVNLPAVASVGLSANVTHICGLGCAGCGASERGY
jgi:hypothetical protein